MENGVEEQKILQQLFDVLDGRLPSMTKYERKDYNEFGDIIVGDFLVVGQENGETISLSEEKIKKYMERFNLKRRLLWEKMI